MNDPELKQLFYKGLFILAVVIVFTVPIYFIYKNKIAVPESKILKDIRKDKTMLLYITETNCSMCKTLKKELNNTNIDYRELNKDKERDYKSIITQLGLKTDNIYTPTIIYIEKGEVISYIVDIESKERLKDYLKDYK